jgi:Mrp family chromosome partitioning ATPase
MSENPNVNFSPTEKLNVPRSDGKQGKGVELAPTQTLVAMPETGDSKSFAVASSERNEAAAIVDAVAPQSFVPSNIERTNTIPMQQPRVGSETQKPQKSVTVNKAYAPAAKTTKPAVYVPSLPSAKRPKEVVRVLRTRCKQLGVSLFFQENTTVRSLGFTSAIAGEGKTFLAQLTAEVMAEDSDLPVVLLECNWENPMLSSMYNLAPSPGLSDWLLGRCSLEAIRRQVASNLTVIPAGDSVYSATKLLHKLQQRGTDSVLTSPDEILIVDLPATVTTDYGPFAAQLVDELILVIRMGVTPEAFVTEACNYLKDVHVYGVIFNQVTSRIPRWLRRIL